MKLINDLYKNVRDPKWYIEQFESEKGVKNALFIDPVMMSFDFYTMIIPYLALAEDDKKFRTAITGLYRYSEIDTKPQTSLTSSQVRWADVVVIPNQLEPFELLFKEIRDVNPLVKIIQTVEFDFYEITNDHYLLSDSTIDAILKKREEPINAKTRTETRKKLKEYIIKRLATNLNLADRILVLNANLRDKLIEKGFKDVQYTPILIDETTFLENINYSETVGTRLTEKMFILSCELSESTKSAFKEWIPQFRELVNKYKSKFKLVVMGEDPKKVFPDFDVDHTLIKTGSIISHFKLVNKSSADIHLALNKKNLYSSNSETLYSFIDRGLFGIPVATLDVPPLRDVIQANQNGFILKKRTDLLLLVAEHIKSKKKLMEVSKAVKETVLKNCQVSDENIAQLSKIFFTFEPEAKIIEEEIA